MSFPYKRIAVIGCPGGGKSTFSRALQEITELPLYHLDAIYWKPDRTTLPKEEFRARLRQILAEDAWIIDGNYQSTMEWRVEASDLLIFLDYPAEVCLEGVRARRGQKRADMPWVEEEEDAAFMAFITAFSDETRPKILALLEQYPHKAVQTFTTREEADAYLAAAAATAGKL